MRVLLLATLAALAPAVATAQTRPSSGIFGPMPAGTGLVTAPPRPPQGAYNPYAPPQPPQAYRAPRPPRAQAEPDLDLGGTYAPILKKYPKPQPYRPFQPAPPGYGLTR